MLGASHVCFTRDLLLRASARMVDYQTTASQQLELRLIGARRPLTCKIDCQVPIVLTYTLCFYP
jgi:hypothetical protein